MPSQPPNRKPMGRRSITAPFSAKSPETRLLADIGRLEWMHAPPPIERLETALGRERLSQLLLLVALSPEEDRHVRPFAATQAA